MSSKKFIYKKGVLYLRGEKSEKQRNLTRIRVDTGKTPSIDILEESKELTRLVFKDLPKISLNEWYAGTHWKQRTKIKNSYKLWIESMYKKKFRDPCKVDYLFEFEKHALDPTNCVAMVKLIEDVLFPVDSGKIIKGFFVSSDRGTENKVTVIIRLI